MLKLKPRGPGVPRRTVAEVETLLEAYRVARAFFQQNPNATHMRVLGASNRLVSVFKRAQ